MNDVLRVGGKGRVALAISALAVLAGVVIAADREAPIERPVVRAAAQVATQGLTAQELIVRHQDLHNWLMTELPEGARERPVTVQLTDAEITDLATIDLTAPGPLRVGTVKEVTPGADVNNLRPKLLTQRSKRLSTGVLEQTDGGGFVWATAVTSPGAVGLRVHFTNFSIPEDADMYIFSLEGEAFGPYQRRGPQDTGEFWSHSIMSDTAILLLRHFGPAGADDLARVSFTISDVGHIAHGLGSSGGEGGAAAFCSYNDSCVENTNCVGGQPGFIADVENAAAKMRWIAGCCIYLCSGGLIADTAGSQTPYFLTANHCLNKNNVAANLEAFFQYQVNCGAGCPEPYFDPHNGVARTMGSSVVATNRSGDFTLLQLDQAPPAGSVFLGWNNSPIASSNGAALYRISHPAGAPQAYSSHNVDANSPTCTGWPRGERIYSTDDVGATEGGSSGSPVVNASGEIVGQLSGCCGFNCGDVCDTGSNWTVDGAFAHYYSSVAPFLDNGGGCVPSAENCTNGTDDDCDGDVDCNDADCSGDPACAGGGCVNPGGLPQGASCTSDSQCCNNKCKGPPGNMTCR
jgi:hypothetical protein